jgi:hypothetical protein
MTHSAVQKLINHKKLIGTVALGVFIALVFIPVLGGPTAQAQNPNTTGKDQGGVRGSGTFGNGHSCYARANGLPEGCRS